MSENNVSLKEFNTKIVLKRIEKKKALCPSCEKRVKLAGSLYIYKNKDTNEILYYVNCRKCEYKKDRQTEEKIETIRLKTEEKLRENRFPYACEVVDDPNIERMLDNVVHGSQKIKMNVFEQTLGVWHIEDEKFFKENPSRKFLARRIYQGELEETNRESPELRTDAVRKNISFALVHSVGTDQRVYSYVSDLTGRPYEEEAFVAALYIIRVNDMFSIDDLDDLYEKIKENKNIVTDFKLNNFTD